MWLRRLAWLLPVLALVVLQDQLDFLFHAPGLGPSLVLFLVAADILFLAAVYHVFRSLLRPEPLALSTLFLGTFGLSILVSLVASVPGGRMPPLFGVVTIFKYTAFGLTTWGWVRLGSGKEKPAFRTWLTVVLYLGMLTWLILLSRSVIGLSDEHGWKGMALAGIVIPLLAYFVLLAHRLRRRQRLSDGMLLLGMFAILPGGWLGPFLILGKAGLAPCMLWFYLGGAIFVAMVVAWSKGGKGCPPPLPDR